MEAMIPALDHATVLGRRVLAKPAHTKSKGRGAILAASSAAKIIHPLTELFAWG
jgi:hypothetical protein